MDARDLEVRCEWCDAGFAAGTRTCVHCNRPLGRPRPVPELDASSLDPLGSSDETSTEEPVAGIWTNFIPGLIAVLFVVLSAVARACGS